MTIEVEIPLLLSVVCCLLIALFELRARRKYMINHDFWVSWKYFKSAASWIFGLGRWRVVCPDCKGTGICQLGNSEYPHSCCGDCGRTYIPVSKAPTGFNRGSSFSDGTVIIGTGWIWGSFWSGLYNGFYHNRIVKKGRKAYD